MTELSRRNFLFLSGATALVAATSPAYQVVADVLTEPEAGPVLTLPNLPAGARVMLGWPTGGIIFEGVADGGDMKIAQPARIFTPDFALSTRVRADGFRPVEIVNQPFMHGSATMHIPLVAEDGRQLHEF